MKLKYKTVDKLRNQSMFAKRENIPNLDNNWHFHEEFELIYTIKGNGVRVVGDSLSHFKNTELVLVGSGLPHLWINEDVEEDDGVVDVVIVKFTEKLSGKELFTIPEFSGIYRMLKESNRGILFCKEDIGKVHDLLIDITKYQGAQRIINLLSILQLLSESDDCSLLASLEFSLQSSSTDDDRLGKIINYISHNFTEQITLDDISKETAMTTNSLCRFFKSRTNKTVFQFINEFRLGKACQMLINGNHSVSEICFFSGFNSLTSFNRVFKSIKGVSPTEYKKKYKMLGK